MKPAPAVEVLRQRTADATTAFSGHMVFVYVHVAWFGLWTF